MKRAEQEGLPGIPQPAKRRVIDALEDMCVDRDKQASKRTAISDKVAEIAEAIQAKMIELKIDLYTYEDANGILHDVYQKPKLQRTRSKLNPRKVKGDE